jgi:RND family efflux transporter MFP subunit
MKKEKDFFVGKTLSYIITIIVIAVAAFLIWYFIVRKPGTPPPQLMQQAPAVNVAFPEVKDVEDYYEFTGNIAAPNQVDVRARVEGFLLTVDFNDGDHVKAGDLLFTIEPNQYQNTVDLTRAQLISDKSALLNAQLDLKRTQKAIETNSVSRQQLTTAQAARDQAQAKVMVTEAQLKTANLNLDYTKIFSPITGKISRRLVDPGNLVGAGGTQTLLATVVQTQPVYVYFYASETVMQDYFLTRNIQNPVSQKQLVRAEFPDQNDYPFEGFLNFIDNTIDLNTGTILMRAQMPNKDEKLFPGMFVRVKLPTEIIKNAILVEEKAINSDIGGKYLYVVDSNDVLHTSYIKEGKKIGEYKVILSGITRDQKYVLSGFHMIRPGMKIKPVLQGQKNETTPAAKTGIIDKV